MSQSITEQFRAPFGFDPSSVCFLPARAGTQTIAGFSAGSMGPDKLLPTGRTLLDRRSRGMLGLWSRKLWLVCILAQVKLICNEAVKLTRKGERPLPLGMGRCH